MAGCSPAQRRRRSACTPAPRLPAPHAPPFSPYLCAHAALCPVVPWPRPQLLQVCVFMKDVQHPGVGVLLESVQAVGAQPRPQRQPGTCRRHQQRLPRRAVAPREAGAQHADGAQREGQRLPVDGCAVVQLRRQADGGAALQLGQPQL